MQPTSGLLTLLHQRLGTSGLALLAALVVLTIAAAMAFVLVTDVLAVSADPIQVAPFRWLRRC